MGVKGSDQRKQEPLSNTKIKLSVIERQDMVLTSVRSLISNSDTTWCLTLCRVKNMLYLPTLVCHSLHGVGRWKHQLRLWYCDKQGMIPNFYKSDNNGAIVFGQAGHGWDSDPHKYMFSGVSIMNVVIWHYY